MNRSIAECKRGCVVVGAPDFRPLPSGFAAALPGAKVYIMHNNVHNLSHTTLSGCYSITRHYHDTMCTIYTTPHCCCSCCSHTVDVGMFYVLV
jgi:hypothetical protein